MVSHPLHMKGVPYELAKLAINFATYRILHFGYILVPGLSNIFFTTVQAVEITTDWHKNGYKTSELWTLPAYCMWLIK